MNKQTITVSATIAAPVDKVWKLWNTPEDITQWNSASNDWHTPHATNDLRIGGKIMSRMEAKDGSMGFDFWGIYTDIKEHELIAYTLGDDRKVMIHFTGNGDSTEVTETFDAENENSLELQQMGWQAIMNSFKKYAESK